MGPVTVTAFGGHPLLRRGRAVATAVGVLAGRRLRTRGAAVLAYHDVGDALVHTSEYHVTSGQLRAQLRAALDFGARFVDTEAMVDRLLAGRSIDGLVAITFDDGLVSLRDHALPVLGELGLAVTAFVPTRERGVRPSFFPRAERTMTGAELAALVRAGVRLGSHSVSHRVLPGLPLDELTREFVDSRAELEDLSGGPVDLLAYPQGRHDAVVRRAAAEAGYRAAFTFHNGRVARDTDPFALPRLTMGPHHTRARLAYHLARPAASWPLDTENT